MKSITDRLQKGSRRDRPFKSVVKDRTEFPPGDRTLLLIVLILGLLGLVMVYSASGILAGKTHHDSTYFLKKQLLWMGFGLTLFVIASRVEMERLRKWIFPMICLIFALLVGVLLFGVEINGSRRWIRVGPMTFQPSELAKLFTVVYLSHYIAKKGERLSDFSEGLVPALMMIGLETALILVEPDLGTTAIIVLIALILLFLGGVSLRHLLPVGLGMIPLFLYWILKTPYRRERVMTYLNPWAEPASSGFQMIQSYLALGSGGAVGAGLGEGKQKLFFLPEPHTDFIFAVIGEELGLIGTFLVLFLFVWLLWKGTRIALATEEPFSRMLAIGTTLLLTLPAFMNMGVVTGLLPTKGLPLPFVSYGGSSLLVSWAALGLLFNVSRRADFRRSLVQIDRRTASASSGRLF
jgi:cell division protein FtsW